MLPRWKDIFAAGDGVVRDEGSLEVAGVGGVVLLLGGSELCGEGSSVLKGAVQVKEQFLTALTSANHLRDHPYLRVPSGSRAV